VRHFFLWPREGEVVTVTSRYSIKQHTNSNKHYIYHLYSKVLKSQALLITLCPLLFVFATRFPNKTRPQSAIPRTAPGPKLCPNVALINPTQHQKIESRSETRAPPLPRIELIQKVAPMTTVFFGGGTQRSCWFARLLSHCDTHAP